MRKPKVVRSIADAPRPTHTSALDEMNAQTDRGAAVAGTAFLDLVLREVIETKLRPEVAVSDAMFGANGVLATFSSRIEVAYALSLIGAGAYADLQALRAIRNAFAHSAYALTFEQEDVAALCESLWFARTIHYQGKPDPKTPRERFVREVKLLADVLSTSIHPTHPDRTSIHFGPAKARPAPSRRTPKTRPSRGPRQ